MPRSSFARSVARAAASGGSKSYRAQRPTAWYLLMTIVVILGIGLTIYSRNEKNSSGANAVVAPTATDHWVSALGIDLCGSMQPNLPASTNLTSVGIRTFGNGLIDINPGAVAGSSAFTGTNDTLGVFAFNYSALTLTNTSIKVPGKLPITWTNGANCNGPLHGKATLVAKVWSSPTATPTIVSSNITGIHLDNGEMITLAFVPSGAPIPEPASKATLIATMVENAKIGSIGTTTTVPTTAPLGTTPTTAAGSTPTTAAGSTPTSSSTTPAGSSSTSSTSGVPSATPSTSSNSTTSTTTSG